MDENQTETNWVLIYVLQLKMMINILTKECDFEVARSVNEPQFHLRLW